MTLRTITINTDTHVVVPMSLFEDAKVIFCSDVEPNTNGDCFDVIEWFKSSIAAATQPEPVCSQHPDAPHGFARDASHAAGKYVCECDGWEPEQSGDINEMVRDAARYRWLRENRFIWTTPIFPEQSQSPGFVALEFKWMPVMTHKPTRDDLDAAIDAEIAKDKELG